MADERGLSIFDSTPERAPFPVTRRGGYDRAAVDAYLADAESERVDTARRLRELEDELSSLRERLAEIDEPTYAGLGGRAAELLRLAEEQADAMQEAATREADDISARAAAEAAAVRADAQRDAEQTRLSAMQELEQRRVSALAHAALLTEPRMTPASWQPVRTLLLGPSSG